MDEKNIKFVLLYVINDAWVRREFSLIFGVKFALSKLVNRNLSQIQQ